MAERLWAPWRLAYVGTRSERDDVRPDEGCVFCLDPEPVDDRSRLVLYRGPHAFAVLNRFPYSSGHVLVCPRAHVADPSELDSATDQALHGLLRTTIACVRRAFGPDGVNVGMNLGPAAGAGVPGHMHWHVVPRWDGDTNFMTVVGDARVLPQALDAAWEVLAPLYQPGGAE